MRRSTIQWVVFQIWFARSYTFKFSVKKEGFQQDHDICYICYYKLTIPTRIENCGHEFCYVCLKSKIYFFFFKFFSHFTIFNNFFSFQVTLPWVMIVPFVVGKSLQVFFRCLFATTWISICSAPKIMLTNVQIWLIEIISENLTSKDKVF